MDEFRFFALGEDFNVDAFAAKCSLEPSYIWRKGEVKRYSCVGTPYPSSGIEFRLGNEAKIAFPAQQALAIAFIQKHREALSRLSAFPGVTHCTLGLQYDAKFESNVVGFSMSASKELMSLLVEVGFNLTHYVSLERESEANDA